MAYISGTVHDDTGAAVGGRTVRTYRRDTGAFLRETTSASGSVSGDASFASVVALLHAEGADASTVLTDSSESQKTFTCYGNAQISTARYKYGSSSILLDGTGDYIKASSHADFGFGTGDYTIEAWVWLNNSAAETVLFDWRGNGGDGQYPLLYITSGALKLYINSGVQITAASSGDIASQTWTHVALSRVSGTTRMFVGGVQKGSSYTDSGNYAQNSVVFGISTYDYSGSATNGNFDGIRITKGVGRYSANFTPSTVTYPDSPVDLTAGGYCIPTTYTGEVNVVTLDDSGGTTYNDLILRTTPV